MTTEQMWQVVLGRSREHDGKLYYAVRSTGVYCRPSCPSRRPRRESVEFFASAEEAERAGYRACRRCRPTEVAAAVQAVEAARRAIDAAVEEQMGKEVEEGSTARFTLASLAAQAGMSPYHLQRTFKRMLGVTPREYRQAVRVQRLKHGMRAGEPVTGAIYAAGFGSSSRVYETAARELGMTPGQYRRRGAGLVIRYGCFASPLGTVLLAATERGLCSLAFGEDEGPLRQALRQEFSAADLREDAAALVPYHDALLQWLSDVPAAGLVLPLDPQGTTFQRRVWNLLQQIPVGETRTYQQLAEATGDRRAVRAVARACATNPIAIAIPCHRVLRKDGALAGYRWGLERKQKLLEHEGRQRRPGAAPCCDE